MYFESIANRKSSKYCIQLKKSAEIRNTLAGHKNNKFCVFWIENGEKIAGEKQNQQIAQDSDT